MLSRDVERIMADHVTAKSEPRSAPAAPRHDPNTSSEKCENGLMLSQVGHRINQNEDTGGTLIAINIAEAGKQEKKLTTIEQGMAIAKKGYDLGTLSPKSVDVVRTT